MTARYPSHEVVDSPNMTTGPEISLEPITTPG
jgi:hypothetical protein